MNTRLIYKECADERKAHFQANHTIADVAVGDNVKVAFTEDGAIEHMWIDVERIEGSKIIGKLNNDPVRIKSLKFLDSVECDFEDVEQLYK